MQGKSKKAFSENVKKEMDSGKPQPQALAIAYSVKRKNRKANGGKISYPDHNYGKRENPQEMHEEMERQRMANGGAVEETPSKSIPLNEDERQELEDLRAIHAQHMSEMPHMADGGNVDLEQSQEEPQDESIAHQIMRKRKMMADGGEVDLENNSEESLNNEDQMSFKAGLKEQYDLSQLDEQPEDSNEDSDPIMSDDHDMVQEIRKKMKSVKKGM